jgi:hypothetical protein
MFSYIILFCPLNVAKKTRELLLTGSHIPISLLQQRQLSRAAHQCNRRPLFARKRAQTA